MWNRVVRGRRPDRDVMMIIDEFTVQYPEVDVVNMTAVIGDGQVARETLLERMDANDPPDVFQLGPRDFEVWVEYGGDAADNRLESLDDLFNAEGWTTLYPAGVLEVLQYDGVFYAVPVNMHRQNSLFYNTEIVATPPATMAEFLTLAEELNGDGIVPLAVSAGTGGWTLEIIFFSILSGTAGAEFHNTFYTGNADMSDAATIATLEEALANYQTIIGYANADAGDLGWDAAAGLVADGTAAMYIHGDWAKGYYVSLGLTPGVDFGAAPAPGTADEFIYNVDTFALCAGAPNRENALNFLRVVGSADAQGAFNQLKGSTPVHPDVDISAWDDVATSTVDHLESATILHNVEINQFSVPGATPEDAAVGMADQLLALYNGDITDADLITWIVDNYAVATTR